MMSEHRAVGALRVFLVLLFGLLVMFQTLSFPGQFAHMAQESPDLAHLRWPLTALTAFWLLCVEAVVISTWKLLTLVRRDRIFSDAAFFWVDVIVWAIVSAWLALVGAGIYVFSRSDDPGFPLLVLAAAIGVAVLGLLMVVMRALLRRATVLRADMETVI